MVYGKLVGLSPATLQSIIAAGEQCIVANAVRGVNYSIAGRSFGFPSLADAMDMINEANYALGLITGARSTAVRVNFNPALGRGRGTQTGLQTAPPYTGGDGNTN
jgi:hypothetical protein